MDITKPDTPRPQRPSSRVPGTRLTVAGAIATGAVAVLHAVAMGTAHWSDWVAGALRDGTAGADAWTSFWAQPGGFVAALIALAILLAAMARRGHTPPVSVGIVLVVWVALCLVLVGPLTGFSLAAVPASLVLAAGIRGRLAKTRNELPG